MNATPDSHCVFQGTSKGNSAVDAERWCLEVYGHKDGDILLL